MARNVFFSFHYKADNWRVSQIKQIGSLEGQPVCSANKWEEVEAGGDKAIQKWIDDNMVGKTCLVVLIGQKTAGREWVEYEIKKAWKDKKGVLGVYIHNLKDKDGNQSAKGTNPFSGFNVGDDPLTKYAKAYDPPSSSSTSVYDHIKENIETWIEEAIRLRGTA